MRLIPMAKVPLAAALGVAALLTLASAPAAAEYYQYTYTGNLFTRTYEDPWAPIGDPNGGRTFSLVSINAVVTTNAPLGSTVTLADVLSFSISMTSPDPFGPHATLSYPFPPPIDCGGGSCPSPSYSGSLTMSDFNFLNQPTSWDLSIGTQTFYPTGRMGWLTLSTSRGRDMLDGGYETAYAEYGGLITSPGVWAMSVVVPEPATYASMLAGVALLAGLSRWRRTRRDRTPG
ncbi:PEP-CTERM sorting domain-containing protein [Mitsuaria sp. 7]|uniref:PEP-CTERM sorting domain-containing protein n=1 Tax=Mitsuaria sp. 7 TaxID=1658665 RepID=UPI0018D45154|nr:PEP-CTERM sorting domain-containing protein [Mitsuaria sp. 7]